LVFCLLGRLPATVVTFSITSSNFNIGVLSTRLSLAKYGVARVVEKSGSSAAALQIATSQYYEGLSKVATPGSPRPSACPHSEIIDYRGCSPDIALAPNGKRWIVKRSSQIVRAGANGHGVCRPVLDSAANCPGVAGRPSAEQDGPVIRKDRTAYFGAANEQMNVGIKVMVHCVMENGTREISKYRTGPPRTQNIGGSRITHIGHYA